MADDGPDAKNQKKSAKHDSGAADLERVTDYAEEKEISSDITGAVATIGERRRKEAQEKMEREIELAKVPIRKDDVELIGPVDTVGVAEAVLQWLTDNKIHHTVFARTVLGWNTAFTPLLRKPVAWATADQRTRKAYQAMYHWLRRPHVERLETVREKQDQMNRKRRTESTQKDRRRSAGPGGGGRPPQLGPAEPLHGFGGGELAGPVGGYGAPPAHGYGAELGRRPGAGFPEEDLSQPEFALVDGGQPPAPFAYGLGEAASAAAAAPAAALPPPSYHDTVQQLGGFGDRPPPLYSAPLPGYEELSAGYAPPPPPPPPPPPQPQPPAAPPEVTFAHLPAVGDGGGVQEPLSPPELLSPTADGRPARVQISPLQRRALVDIFHVTARPSSSMRQLIATTLDLPQRTVSNFFSSARTRGLRKQLGPESHGKENLVDAMP